MKKIKCFLLFITLMAIGCAKPTSPDADPNAFYYYAYAKYSITISDYTNWSGLFFFPDEGKFSFNFINTTDFSACSLGLTSYTTTSPSVYFPTVDGDSLSFSGNLLESAGTCSNSIASVSMKRVGVHLGIPFYEMTIGSERYLIRTNK